MQLTNSKATEGCAEALGRHTEYFAVNAEYDALLILFGTHGFTVQTFVIT